MPRDLDGHPCRTSFPKDKDQENARSWTKCIGAIGSRSEDELRVSVFSTQSASCRGGYYAAVTQVSHNSLLVGGSIYKYADWLWASVAEQAA